MEGRTVLLITQRLVGLKAMDEVVMLEGGQIEERGRHADLMQKNPRYRRYHDLLFFHSTERLRKVSIRASLPDDDENP